jgi:hypothetical protein
LGGKAVAVGIYSLARAHGSARVEMQLGVERSASIRVIASADISAFRLVQWM